MGRCSAVKAVNQLLDVLGGGLGLAVEEGRGGDLASPQMLGDGLEVEAFLGLGFEEGAAVVG